MEQTASEFTLRDLPGFGLALLLIVLFMVGYRYVATYGIPRLRRRWPVVPSVPSPTPMQSPLSNGELVPVNTWLPYLFERAAHIVILGGSGSGKTRTARGLVRYIVEQRREQVVILDPKANRDTWMGLPACVDAAAIDQAMHLLLAEFKARLDQNPTLTEAEAEAAFTRIWIVVDEVSFVRDNCTHWQIFLRRISSMARSLKLHLVIVNQSERVDELGLKGRGDLLANFARIGLSSAVWDGAPAEIAIGAQTIPGDWLSFFPHAYQGTSLPAEAVASLVRRREPPGSPEPVPDVGTTRNQREPVPDTTEPGNELPGTGSHEPIMLNEEEQIRRLAVQGWSRNQIASELGGGRSAALERIRRVLDDLSLEGVA
jgi:hypothetical protein